MTDTLYTVKFRNNTLFNYASYEDYIYDDLISVKIKPDLLDKVPYPPAITHTQ